MSANEKSLAGAELAFTKVERWLTALSLLLLVIFFLWSLRGSLIYDETEGQYAGAVREMRESGSWISMNNGIPRLQKPPLVYLSMQASEALFGRGEVAMRIPFLLALFGWFAVTYALGRDLMDCSFGRAAALGLGTMLGVTVFGRMIMPESFLALGISVTAYAFLRALRELERGGAWWTISWVAMGFGSLAKGFHAALWPLAVALICWALGVWERRRWKELFRGPGPFLFLVMVIPWYLVVEHKYPGFLRENLWNEQVGHALDFRNPPTYQRVPLGIFLIQHLFLLFPSILWFPAALFCWKECARCFRDVREVQFLMIWIGVVLLTSCFSARQDYYTMSMWGAVALMAAAVFRASLSKKIIVIPLVILSVGGIAATFAVGSLGNVSSGGFRSDTSDQFLGVLLNLPADAVLALTRGLWMSAITLIAGAALGGAAIYRHCRQFIPHSLVIAMSGPLVGAVLGFQVMGDYFSLKRPAQVILDSGPGVVVVDGPHQLASSLFYYLAQPIHFVRGERNAEFAVRIHGIGQDRYWEISDLKREWEGPGRLWFIVSAREVEFWRKTVELPVYEFSAGNAGARVLLSNRRE